MPLTSVAAAAVASEIRAPAIRRLSMSRPSWSVPSKCFIVPPACHAGGSRLSPRLTASLGYGASQVPKIAATTSRAQQTHVTIGNGGCPPVLADDGNHRSSHGIVLDGVARTACESLIGTTRTLAAAP